MAVDCTLDFLLTWAWQRGQVLKKNADILCMPLFDHSGTRLDGNSYKTVSSCVRQLDNIAKLFKYVIEKCLLYLSTPGIVPLWELRVVDNF